MDYSITNYPLVVDPATDAIELHAAPQVPEGATTTARSGWRQFIRVFPSGENNLPFIPTPARAHFFGDGPTVPTSNLMLVYDNRGAVQCMLVRNANPKAGWDYFAIPEEYSGQAVRPSVRLTFADHGECQAAMELLGKFIQDFRDGKSINTTATQLAELLSQGRDIVYTPVLIKLVQ